MVRSALGVLFSSIAGAIVGFIVSVVAALTAQLLVPLDSPPDYMLYGTPLGAVAGTASYLYRRRHGGPGTITR